MLWNISRLFPSATGHLSVYFCFQASSRVIQSRQFYVELLKCSADEVTQKNSKMVRVLNVAEKNDAAKNLSELLSRGRCQRKEGRSRFNKIYEFEYSLFNQQVTMAVTSVSGHLLGLDFVGNYKSWQAVDPLVLFEAPVSKFCPPDYQDIKRTLEEETRKSQYLIIWTDCDREGENIGYEIISVCRAIKPNIPVYRAKFSEITYQSIVRAVQNLAEPNKNISDAVDVRQELDLRFGAAFTRLQTLRLKQVFPETLGQSLVSYGSCQFPTLGFVVERYKAIQEFVGEPFWKIKVIWEPNEEEKVDFLWKRHHLFDRLAVQVLHERCLENPEATVVKLQTKSKSKWRPTPLDTVELEKLASRKLRINAKETMKIAEKLYTQGYISYPRTETNIFPKELKLQPLVEMQTGDQGWGNFAQRVLEQGINPRQGKKSDQAHPPIHPTKYISLAQLSSDNERKIYEFIVRHFLACVSQDAQGYETVVEINIANEGFVASGLQIVARNYLEVYPYDRWSDRSLPQFSEGQQFQPTSINLDEGQTSPPQLLTEADLIALMEKHGIGTDATHAEHIETIKSRMYVGVQDGDGRFLPRSLGMGLVQGYDDIGITLSKPNLRADLEADLKRICDGQRDPKDVLREQIDRYRTNFIQVAAQLEKIDQALSAYISEQPREARNVHPGTGPDGQPPAKYCTCPQCQLDMILRRKKGDQNQVGGFFMSCMGYPQCKSAIWLPNTVRSVEMDPRTCPTCSTRPHLLKMTFTEGAYSPLYPDVYTGCIGGCDPGLNQALGIRSPSASQRPVESRNFNHSAANSATRTNSNSSTQQWNGGQRDAAPRPAPPVPAPPSNRRADSEDSSIVCSCNEPAVLLTVRKDGPNKGRQFYKCAKIQGQGNCDFFLWSDAASTQSDSDSRPAPRRPPPDDDSNSGAVCGCNEPAKLLTVQKEGPNKGRQFYACAKPRESQCSFFQWADEAAGSGGFREEPNYDSSRGTNSRGRGRGRGRAAAASGGEPRRRKCGLCGQEGHIRSRCPNGEG